MTHAAASRVGSSRLLGGTHYGPPTGPLPSRLQPNNRNDHGQGAVKRLMVSPGQNHRGVKSVSDRVHKQVHPWGSESTLSLSRGTSNPFQSEYTADLVPRLSRGPLVINRQPYFEEIKPAVPGIPKAARWDPQGQMTPGSFVYRDHDLVDDESAPNRHGVFRRGFSLPRSWSRGPYQRGLAGYGPGREAATPRSAVPAMNRSPVDRMKRIWVPSMNFKRFVKGRPGKHAMTNFRLI